MNTIKSELPFVRSYIGEYEVIGNGIIPTADGTPLRIKIDNLEIEFDFRTDKSNETKVERGSRQ